MAGLWCLTIDHTVCLLPASRLRMLCWRCVPCVAHVCCATAAVFEAGVADPPGVLCARGEQGTSPSRVSYRLAHTCRCLEALVAGVAAALIITLHDNTITMAATSWAVSVLAPSMSAETRSTPSASFLCERLDCHAGALFRSPSSRRLGVAGLASHGSQSNSGGCMRAGTCATAVSSLLMRSILGDRGHVTTSDSSVHAASALLKREP